MNPDSNMESFDTIYYSALQVFIVISANGVSNSTSLHLLSLTCD